MEGQNIDESNSAINISDVIEVIETDPAFGSMEPKKATLDGVAGAYVKIIEQPASKALRFRYECEGRSAGSIPGVSSTPENKTFPTIQIVGYQGRAVVVVSCVTKDHPYKPHPHNLVGKEGCKKGVCTVELNNENMIATFANLGIQCVKKKDIEDALRMREEIRVDPFRTGFSHRGQPSSIDLNSVRLCFQAFLEGPHKGKFTIPLPAVVSEPIYDKKAMADLVICKLSHCSGSVAGGNEIILLCEKVAKEDITVRFYEEKDGQVIWEGYGDFTPTQVHKQVAISFRTPRYKTLEIDQPVKVLIQLRRPSDNATSEALPFQLTPLDSDPALLKRKRQKFNSENEVLMRQLQETEQMRLSHVTEHPGLSVKREPAETSPTSYMMFGGTMNVRNTAYASRTPSPLEYAVGAYPQGSYQAQAAVYQMVYSPASPLLSPGLPQQLLQPPQPEQVYSVVEDQVKLPTNNILNMDTHEYSIELNLERLNSKDLAELSMLDAGSLSANLSNNLNLNEEKHTGENMTDSFTRLTTNTLNELCALNDMYQASTSNQ